MNEFIYEGQGLYYSEVGTAAHDGQFYSVGSGEPYWPDYAIRKVGNQYLVGRHANGEYAVFAVATSLARAKALVGEEVQS
jgi:hypothetical protein